MIGDSYAPPLHVWMLCGLIVASLLTWSYLDPAPYSFDKKEAQWQHFQDCADNLEADWPFDSSQFKVVIWGSSLTCQGIYHPPYFSQSLDSICGQDVLIQKLYMIKSDYIDLVNLERLFSLTADIKPDLILIEDHLMFYVEAHGIYFNLKSHFRSKINELFGQENPSVRRLRKRPYFDSYNEKIARRIQADTTHFPLRNRKINSFAQQQKLRDLLQQYGLSALPIIALNLPRPRPIEAHYLRPEHLEKINDLIDQYRSQGYDVDFWKYPEALPFTYYSDYGHLNAAGRDKYSSWLVDQLATYLERQCSYSSS